MKRLPECQGIELASVGVDGKPTLSYPGQGKADTHLCHAAVDRLLAELDAIYEIR